MKTQDLSEVPKIESIPTPRIYLLEGIAGTSGSAQLFKLVAGQIGIANLKELIGKKLVTSNSSGGYVLTSYAKLCLPLAKSC